MRIITTRKKLKKLLLQENKSLITENGIENSIDDIISDWVNGNISDVLDAIGHIPRGYRMDTIKEIYNNLKEYDQSGEDATRFLFSLIEKSF